MLQDENMLKSQNLELIIHINTVESDRLKLMKQLKHNVAQMVERKIIFLGLRADHIIKVTEFVSGLKDGSI